MQEPEEIEVDRQLAALLKVAEAQNWLVTPTNQNKLKWTGPDGQGPVFTPTRLVGRSYKNTETELARAGLDVSSLRATKAKETPKEDPIVKPDKGREVAIDISDPLSPATQSLLNAAGLKETAKAYVEAAKKGPPELDKLVALFISDCVSSLMHFLEKGDLVPSGLGENARDIDAALAMAAETERKLTDAQAGLALAETRITKLEGEKSELGEQVRDIHRKLGEQTERANTAEQKLATLKSLFRD